MTEREQRKPSMAGEIQAKKPGAACREHGHNSHAEGVDIILEKRNSEEKGNTPYRSAGSRKDSIHWCIEPRPRHGTS